MFVHCAQLCFNMVYHSQVYQTKSLYKVCMYIYAHNHNPFCILLHNSVCVGPNPVLFNPSFLLYACTTRITNSEAEHTLLELLFFLFFYILSHNNVMRVSRFVEKNQEQGPLQQPQGKKWKFFCCRLERKKIEI